MNKILSLSILFVICFSGNGQNEPANSLTDLKRAKNASDSLPALNRLTNWYLYENADSAAYFLNLTRKPALKGEDAIELTNYYRLQGIYLADLLGESRKGRKMFFKSLHIADSIDSREGQELAYTELGYNYRVTGQLDSSNLYFTKTLQVIKKGDSIGRAAVLNGIGLNYKSVGATEEAASAFFEVLKLVEGNHEYETVIYYNLRLLYDAQGELAEAEKYGRLGLIAARKIADRFSIANAEQALGGVLLKSNQYDSAEVYLTDAIKLAESMGSETILINAKTNLATLRIKEQNWKEVYALIQELKQLLPPDRLFTNFSVNNLEIKYYLEKPNPSPEKALEVISQAEKSLDKSALNELKSDLYKLKSEVYEYIDPKRSLNYYIKHDSIEKKLNSEKIKQYSKLLLTQYETEKKDQEIENLTQQATIQSLLIDQRNNQLLVGGLIVFTLVIGGLLYYRSYRIKKEKSEAELEQRFLRSQLNPHFIFNSMTAIQNYLIANENTEQASYYMGMFSTLMRQILENSREEFISLAEEIKMLKNYLELQKVRFEDFEYDIEVDDNLDLEYSAIPPMFGQPFLENSLEHGLFRDKAKKNRVSIRFKKKDKNLIELEVEDTGIGIQEKSVESSHKSLATTIAKERLKSFKVSLKQKIGFDNKNIYSSDGQISGYRVNLILPSEIKTPA